MAKKSSSPTLTAYGEWQFAYDYFNKELFDGELPDCIITLNAENPKVFGYFHGGQYAHLEGEIKDELSMNPKHFFGRPLFAVLATLAHEMCHVWQFHYGEKKSLRTYHNQEWGDKMESIGLMPSLTGQPEGKKTGQSMSHYIIEGDIFEVTCKTLIEEDNFKISWSNRESLITLDDDMLEPEGKDEKEPKKKKQTRAKFTCSGCQANVWGKPSLNIICADCNIKFETEDGEDL